MTTTLQRFASWSHALGFEDIPERVIDRAKLQVLSMLAAVYSGFRTRAVRAIREVSLSSRARGRATVLPSGEKTSPTVAVVANAAASMALDFDDYLFMGHTGHSAVLASLAIAEEEGLGGRDWLRAQVVANEIGGRLGASVVLGPQNGQLWTHLHAPAAAAAAAALLGLEEPACAHAMAIALYQPPLAMWPGFLGPDSKLLSAASPARDGLFAARLAAWGLTGPLDILDAETGFGTMFARHYLPQMLTGMGQTWVTDTLSYKLVPGCAYVDAAVEALLAAAAKFREATGRALDAADVVAVRVRTNLMGAEMERICKAQAGGPLGPVRVNFSLPLSLAIVLRTGRLSPAELDEEWLHACETELRSLAERIQVVHDWNQTLGMLDRMSSQVPLGELLTEMDLRRLLTHKGEGSPPLAGHIEWRARDLLRVASFLWERAPSLVRQAGRAAANGLGRLVSDERAEGRFDLGGVRFDRVAMPFGAEVELETRGNSIFTARVDIPAGAAGRDWAETKGLVRKKFRALASPLLGEDRTSAAIEHIERLDKLESLEPLVSLLVLPGA